MNNIFKTAIFVMAMMISAMAFGQINDNNTPNGYSSNQLGTDVTIYVVNPGNLDTNVTATIKYRWCDNTPQGNWGDWHPIKSANNVATDWIMFNLSTSIDASAVEYMIIAHMNNSEPIKLTCGVFDLSGGNILYITSWNHCNLYDSGAIEAPIPEP